MKKISFALLLLLLVLRVPAQQFLWATDENPGIKKVAFDSVEVMIQEYYDFYKFYIDRSGYTKDGFVESFENSLSFRSINKERWKEFKAKIYNTTKPTVWAIKENFGEGSVVTIYCITKENVNAIGFSNRYESGAEIIHRYDQSKFFKWFRTFLD